MQWTTISRCYRYKQVLFGTAMLLALYYTLLLRYWKTVVTFKDLVMPRIFRSMGKKFASAKTRTTYNSSCSIAFCVVKWTTNVKLLDSDLTVQWMDDITAFVMQLHYSFYSTQKIKTLCAIKYHTNVKL